MPQRPAARREFPPAEILGGLNGGLDGYSDPTTTSWKRWVSATNAFSGQFGYIQRARFAVTVQPTSFSNALLSISSDASAVATAVTTTPHGFSVNQPIIVMGVIDNSPLFNISQNVFNGLFFVKSVVNSTTFTYQVTITNLTGTTLGAIVNSNFWSQGTPFTTLKYFALPGQSSYLLGDINGLMFSFDSSTNNGGYFPTPRLNPSIDPFGRGNSQLNGPWSREALQNIIYEMNGVVKQSGRGANAATVEGFGIDAPVASPQVVLSAGASSNISNIIRTNGFVTCNLASALTVPGGNTIGMINVLVTVGDTSFNGTFVVNSGSGTTQLTWSQIGQNTAFLTPTGTVNVSITKSIGRSYAFAWENANKPHISAPSPSTQFVQYNGQNGAIQLVQQGTISCAGGGTFTITQGTSPTFATPFFSSWVGKLLWIPGSLVGLIVGVTSTALTLLSPTTLVFSSVQFAVVDPQVTHARLYATADSGATYFLVQRNLISLFNTVLTTAGLQFFDNANSEPPNFPFTSEVSQLNNVPPPIGTFISEYQGRLIVFGVPGAGQSFFYSNQELTSVGMPQESFAPLNQYTLPIQNATLSGFQEMPGAALLWSNRQDMFRLTGQLVDNTAAATTTQLGAQITRLPYNLGICSPYAVDLTPLGAIWVTPQAEVWLYTDSYAPRNIGRPIQDTLNSILPAQLTNVRVKYYHNNTRNWLLVACATSGSTTNNTVLVLDLDLLASNGSPSFFVFDMATNQPAWYKYTVPCTSLEVIYEVGGLVRLLAGDIDIIKDIDFSSGTGIEQSVGGASVTLHAWGNDSAPMIKRPTWLRFTGNRDPSQLAADGWSFVVQGIDDDFYTFSVPLSLTLTPGNNDTTALSGNPSQSLGSPFRHSPELFRIGGVNFVMGRRIRFQINFPSGPGVNYQFRQIQIGFGPSPPR